MIGELKKTNRMVKDYKGDLIPKDQARKINDQYYQLGVTCFNMPDGQCYKVGSPKITFDHYSKQYVLVQSTTLLEGIIDSDGNIGKFSKNPFMITLTRPDGSNIHCMAKEIGDQLGYVEDYGSGRFFHKDNLTAANLKEFSKKTIPKAERSEKYNLDLHSGQTQIAIGNYMSAKFPISNMASQIARILGNYTIGMEMEIINGYLPDFVKAKYGVIPVKDGSLRIGGEEGIEYVTIPLAGSRGIQTIYNVLSEASKRCIVNEYCSLHYHIGNVRRDKLYVLSLWKLITDIQTELFGYFPYSRQADIRGAGKLYCAPLQDFGIDYKAITKSVTEVEFKGKVTNEFNKIYTWLNAGHKLGEEFTERKQIREVIKVKGKLMFRDIWLRNVYSTKNIKHSVEGKKWDRSTRYTIVNFLNMFFSNSSTCEWRVHEGTANPTKGMIWLITCIACMRYAEHINFLKKATLADVLKSELPKRLADYIIAYFNYRKSRFKKNDKFYDNWKIVEGKWFSEDPEFEFVNKGLKLQNKELYE